MKIEQLRIKGKHWATFRQGEHSTVIGAQWITPDRGKIGGTTTDRSPRACFVVQFDDGTVDYVPIEEVINSDAWEVVT